MKALKEFFIKYNLIHAISMVSVFVLSLVLSVYVTSFATCSNSTAEAEALANASIVTTENETTETITIPETTTALETTTEVKTTKKYKANKKVKTHVATGDKKKDEDKGNDKVMDNSLKEEKPLPPSEKVPEHHDKLPTPKPITPTKVKDYVYVDSTNLSGWHTFNGDVFYFDPKTHQPLKGLHGFDDNPKDKFPGFYYYFNEYGAKASTLGIDVSHHNGKIDWNKVKSMGVEFAIIRVGFRGYGTSDPIKPVMLDNLCIENIKGAKAAGISVGLYFYSQAINVQEALDEAGACVNVAEKYKIQYPIYFDTEYAHYDPKTHTHTGRADKLSKKDRTDFAVAFCEAIKNAGYTPGIYASRNFYYDNLDFSRLAKYEIWVAHYTNKKTGTDFKYSYEMWQYASDGKVNGISHNTDMNICYYDYKNRTNMKNNGKYVVLTNSDGKKQYEQAEASLEIYKKTRDQKDLKKAKELIQALPRKDVKDALIKKLLKLELEYTTKVEVETTEPIKETTTEPIKETTTELNVKEESRTEKEKIL